jgi:hypothetical protein
MAYIVSTGLLSCGVAVALLSPALGAKNAATLKLAQANTCTTRSGPVPEGTTGVDACINAANLLCPGNGPVFHCRNGRWYCLYSSNHAPLEPCPDDKSGAWFWTSNGLQRGQ